MKVDGYVHQEEAQDKDMYKPKGCCNDQLALESKLMEK